MLSCTVLYVGHSDKPICGEIKGVSLKQNLTAVGETHFSVAQGKRGYGYKVQTEKKKRNPVDPGLTTKLTILRSTTS